MAEITKNDNQKYAWYVLYVLTGVQMFNFIDRQILVVIQELIKEDLGLSDSQLGLLTGLAFAVFYVSLGIPIARFADRSNRKVIISISLALWSTMTALSGLIVNYTQLLLARIGVGVGEAGGAMPAQSVVSDYFPPEKRATALSVFSAGVYIGVMVGFLGGGIIAQKYGWRVTLLTMGIPGILYAFLVYFFVKEPIKGMSETIKTPQVAGSFGENLGKLLSPTFILIAIASGFHSFLAYSLISWLPPLLTRIHEWTPLQIGVTLALSNGLGGILGTLIGGRLADRLGQKDKAWYMRVPMIAGLLCIFPVAAVIFGSGTALIAVMLFLGVFFMSMYLGPMLAVAFSLVRPNMRSFTSSVYFFVLNAIGLGLGPTLIGITSDYLAPSMGVQSVRYAMLWVFLMEVISIILFFLASKRYQKDLEKHELSMQNN